ncbi:hypothetical protein GCM10010305_39510 [Streptomyces termitum]|uniref:Uncharacterized protein n=1 Tax=Streptomyces termitum TaxID=67368 RepID=A0A918T4I4_9ACTN|nr:hypothetical protein GCM10010305_39510 [Streptomyces termitum]
MTHESVRRVPPTTPMERFSFCGAGPVCGARAWGALRVSVIRRFRSMRAVFPSGSGIASGASGDVRGVRGSQG